MSESKQDSAILRDTRTSDLEIEAYLKANYSSGIDSHGAPAPTVVEVKRALEHLDLAAGLLGEPGGDLSYLQGDHFELADEVLGYFIRAISPGDSYYAALELRKNSVTKFSGWLGLPVPEQDTPPEVDATNDNADNALSEAIKFTDEMVDDWRADDLVKDETETSVIINQVLGLLDRKGMLKPSAA